MVKKVTMSTFLRTFHMCFKKKKFLDGGCSYMTLIPMPAKNLNF